MQLHSRIIGNGPPILILHGLFGMSDNWLTIGKTLVERGYSVHLLDLRNHGRSPHAPTHRYPDMCDDLLNYLEQQGLDTVHIIGHSMGGKLAMIFGLLHAEMLKKMVLVDIAPSDYRNPQNTFHTDLIHTLLQIEMTAHSSRGAIRKQLEAKLNDHALAMFLAKNIAKDITKDGKSKGFKWKFNLPVLQKYLQHLYIGLDELEIHAPCPIQTMFIKGNDSEYYLQKHEQDRLFYFPDSQVVGIDDAGHWVHSEQSEKFIEVTTTFLGEKK